jgi:hypothetical protein
MTALEDLVLNCTAIRGMDRYVLWGWVKQMPEGSDTVYASKPTVADFLGVSDDTVFRRTHNLVEATIMINAGEVKVWEPGIETPVYRIDVQKLIELTDATANCGGVQNAVQGSGSPSCLDSSSASGSLTTELRSVGWAGEETSRPSNHKTRNPKTCKRCGVALYRSKNHICQTDGALPQTPQREGFSPSPVPSSGDDVPPAAEAKPAAAPPPTLCPGCAELMKNCTCDDDIGDPCTYCGYKFLPKVTPLPAQSRGRQSLASPPLTG